MLRVVRHRGFKVANLTMQQEANTHAQLRLMLESERDILLLTKQLQKLIDVVDTELIEQTELCSTSYV